MNDLDGIRYSEGTGHVEARPRRRPEVVHTLLVLLAIGLSGVGGSRIHAKEGPPPPKAAIPPVTAAEALRAVPQDQLKRLEKGARYMAFTDAKYLAQAYTRADERAYPGISRFGRQLTELLNKTGRDGSIFFNAIVTNNPDFWRAEREITTIDPSLPYLVAMLAVLADDRINASRMLSLAQATLPLTPTIRRIYSKPEGLLRYQDKMLLQGLPPLAQLQTAEACESASLVVRQRIAHWPNRMELFFRLFDLEARRQKLLSKDAGILEQPLNGLANLTSADQAFVREHDPILAEALHDSIKLWLAKKTLVQQWARWMDDSDPAEHSDIEKSVRAYEAAGREDFAWLTWRHGMVVKGIANETEQRRWQGWCRKLLGVEAADRVITQTAANPRAGTASLPVPFERLSEVWSGDQGMHPLLAIKLERRLASIDVPLEFIPKGSRSEGMFRLQRADCLLNIGAFSGARSEYEQAAKLVTAKVSEPMLAFLLTAEGKYDEAEALFLKLLKDPAYKSLRRAYAEFLYKTGRYEAAQHEYRQCVQDFPNDDYRAIMAELTARRIGRRETEMLRTMRAKLLPGSWTESGISYLLGEMTADELIVRAREGTPYTVVQQECEGAFWIAQVALAEDRTEEAIQWLRRCLATGFTTYVEYAVAKAELERLSPAEADEDKRKKSAPRDSRWSVPA